MRYKQKLNLNKKSETDLAYLAGFVDGEGTLTITSNPNKKERKNPSKSYRFIFQVVNTDKEIIDWIASFLGVGFITRRDPRDDGQKNNKIRYILTAGSFDNVAQICNVLLPYLKVKKPQAQLILEYYRNHKFRKISTREIEIVKEIRILNKRGLQ